MSLKDAYEKKLYLNERLEQERLQKIREEEYYKALCREMSGVDASGKYGYEKTLASQLSSDCYRTFNEFIELCPQSIWKLGGLHKYKLSDGSIHIGHSNDNNSSYFWGLQEYVYLEYHVWEQGYYEDYCSLYSVIIFRDGYVPNRGQNKHDPLKKGNKCFEDFCAHKLLSLRIYGDINEDYYYANRDGSDN